MLKSLSSLGKALNKSEQQSINGGSLGLGPVDCSATPTYFDGYCWVCGVQYPVHHC